MIVGFVFKANNKIYITEYLGSGRFADGRPIDNEEPYEKLGEDQLAFVEIIKFDTKEGDTAFVLRDHGFYTLDNELKKDAKGYEVLLDVDCRDKLCEFVEELKGEI